MKKSDIIRYRYESFGGILHLKRPAALVWVDKDFMRSLGYPASPLWDTTAQILSAPTEVHLSVTNQCSAGCPGCYTGSYRAGERPEEAARELGFEGHKRLLGAMADARVFHVALGGGESMELPWLFDLAAHARRLGLIPNLTTNGFYVTKETAAQCRVFGQINVSIDGIGKHYREVRGIDGFEKADLALTLLRKARCKFGINVVVSRHNFDQLEQIVRYAGKKRVNQIEFLRFKPAGRGTELFAAMDLTPTQSHDFYPLIRRLQKKTRVNLRLDCSFMPLVFAHQPDHGRADLFAAAGCYGGDMLLGVRADGSVNACSFAPTENWDVFNLREWWPDARAFAPFRTWADQAPEPCRSCRYLDLCRGGCHAISLVVHGDMMVPDPGCPLVIAHRGAKD